MRLPPGIATMATVATIATPGSVACASQPPGAEVQLTASR